MSQYQHEVPISCNTAVYLSLPKVKKYTRGIGFIEVMWKIVEAVINTPIKMTVKFHDILYGFYTHQGTGTAIMELNMSQELDRIYQDPLFLLSLDL